jgi:molybdopterin synthase catalytic subunit
VREFPEGAGLKFGDNDQSVHKLRQMNEKVISRFDVEDVAIVYRVGFLGVSENIVLVAVSAAHRDPASSACRSIMDDIKELHESWVKAVSK